MLKPECSCMWIHDKRNQSAKRYLLSWFPCVDCLLFVCFVLSDLSLLCQIFSVKSDIWNREIHSAALHSEKVSFHWSSVYDWPVLWKCETRFLLNIWIDSLYIPALCGSGLADLSLSLCLCCSLLCWTVLLDAVISSVHGQITVCSILSGGEAARRSDGRRRG